MMKNIKYYTLLSAIMLVGLFTACNEDETEGVSFITTYPEFTVEGESLMIVADAGNYSEPGVTAEEGGTSLEVSTQVTGRFSGYSGTSIGTDPDIYTISYNAVNSDGFAGSATRTVVIVSTGDLVTSISGLYKASVVRAGGEDHSNINVLIWEVEDGVYEISHAIGGFYSDGRAFGDLYRAAGATITPISIPLNTYTYESAFITGFGLVIDIDSFMADPETKTITFHGGGDFGNGSFDITMTQVQP